MNSGILATDVTLSENSRSLPSLVRQKQRMRSDDDIGERRGSLQGYQGVGVKRPPVLLVKYKHAVLVHCRIYDQEGSEHTRVSECILTGFRGAFACELWYIKKVNKEGRGCERPSRTFNLQISGRIDILSAGLGEDSPQWSLSA